METEVLIKKPVDLGYVCPEIGCAIECDYIGLDHDFYTRLSEAFGKIYPAYHIAGFKVHDKLLKDGRMFILYCNCPKPRCDC